MSHAVSVIGAGKTSRRHIKALLDDHITANPITAVTVPGSEGLFSDPARFVADWAIDNGIPVTFVVDATPESADLSAEEYTTHGKTLKVADVLTAVLATPTVLLAFQEDDEEEMERWIKEALGNGSEVLDLVDGLWPITVSDADAQDTSAPDAAAEPADVAAAVTEEVIKGADEAQALVKPSEAVSEPHDVDEAAIAEANASLGTIADAQDAADLELGRAVRAVFRMLTK